MAQQAHLDFGNGHTVRFEDTARPLRLWPAVGGARIDLGVRASAGSDTTPATPYRVSAVMNIGANPTLGQLPLCQLTMDSAIQPGRDGGTFTLHGFLSDAQLRAAEEIRGAADDLWIRLEITAVMVEETAVTGGAQNPAPSHTHQARLVDRTASLAFALSSGEWLKAWEQAAAGSYMEVLVPLPTDPGYAKAVERIQTARQLIHGNHLEEALGEARKAIEPVREAYKTRATADTARGKPAKERDKDERWALLVEDLFALVSGAAHDDPGITEHFGWTRPEAVTIVATAAGLLGRLAID